MVIHPQICGKNKHTIVDVLRKRAKIEGDRTAYTFLCDGDRMEETQTFAELYDKACVLAATLAERAAPGERALLLYPSGLEFMPAFFGCLLAGIIPVALSPPGSGIRQAQRGLARMLPIVDSAAPALALTTEQLLPTIRQHLPDLPRLEELTWLASGGDTTGDRPAEPGIRIDPTAVAFLQYTSGSTSQPRGVMVTHQNLMCNERMIATGVGTTVQSVCVSWLPVFHDMGLIGCMLHSVYAGIPCIFMAPIHFIKRPVRWLQAVTRHGGTYSGAPNFAFDLCTRRIPPEHKQTLDLSTWEVAFNSSEPVQADTLDRFCEAFAGVGFRRRALYPAYGLAEATVMVSGGRKEVPPVLTACDRSWLAAGRAEPAAAGASASRLVGAGSTVGEQQIAIVDPASSERLEEGRVGEIWVSGGNVAAGYWGDSTSQSTFAARIAGGCPRHWLRTGDLGFMTGGELYITGRIKDLIIVAGRNHFPQDIELTVEQSHPAVRPGGVAAFPLSSQGEKVVVAAEARPHNAGDPERVRAAIVQAVAEEHDIRLADVCLLRPTAIPRTTSGKIRRYACRALYENGELQ